MPKDFRVEGNPGAALERRIKAMSQGMAATSTEWATLRIDIKALAETDYARRLESGTDRNGQPFAPLKPSTAKARGRGQGGPLNPTGSRLARIAVEWKQVGDGWELVALLPDAPFVIFHIRGTKTLPVRDPTGLSPACHDQINARVKRFLSDLARKARSS